MNLLLRLPQGRYGAICSLLSTRRTVKYAFADLQSANRAIAPLQNPRDEHS